MNAQRSGFALRPTVITLLVNFTAFASAAVLLLSQPVDGDAAAERRPTPQDTVSLRDSLEGLPPSQDLWDRLLPDLLEPPAPRQRDEASPQQERPRCRCSCTGRARSCRSARPGRRRRSTYT